MKLAIIILFSLFFVNNIFSQIASFETSKTEYCLGDTVFFINNSTNNINQKWDFDDGFETYFNNPAHIYLSEGTYTTMLTVYNSAGNSNSISKIIKINELPEIKIIAEPDTIINIGNYLTLTAEGNFDDVIWNNEENTNSITVYLSGIYTAKVSDYETLCINTDSIQIYENSSISENIKITTANNILTPNDDGFNDYLIVENLSKFTSNCELAVYSKSGNLIFQDKNYKNNWAGTFSDGTKLASGTYFFILKTENKTGTGFIDILTN